ncbi:MAG: PEGA domain-containing protein [Deltaproteobacteria bacterium]|nr:PEGA domain-containing protein [Deltaproteobacteria bacterium]
MTALIGGTIAHCAHRVKRERQRRQAPDGVLSVRSNPPGARVVVDGREAPGLTPLFARNLRRGVPLSVQVKLDGHREWSGTASVHADYGDGVLLVKLEPAGPPATQIRGASGLPPPGPPGPATAPAGSPAR